MPTGFGKVLDGADSGERAVCNIDLVHFSFSNFFSMADIQSSLNPPARLAGILPAHEGTRRMSFHVLISPVLSVEGALAGCSVFSRQAFDGYARSARGLDASHRAECGGTMVFNQNTP